MEKKIVKTEFEAVRMIKNYLGYNFDINSNIYLSQFEKIFYPAIFRGSLINLWYSIRQICNRNGEDRFGLNKQKELKNYWKHLVKIQRNLVISGLKNDMSLMG